MKEQIYRDHCIRVGFYHFNKSYFWKVFKEGREIGDNPDYGLNTLEEALTDAKRHIDCLIGINGAGAE